MKKNKSNSLFVLFLLSLIIQFIAYYLSAVYYYRDFAIIFNKPLKEIANVYTPVFMISFFLVFEMIFFVVLLSRNQELFSREEEVANEDNATEKPDSGNKSTDKKKEKEYPGKVSNGETVQEKTIMESVASSSGSDDKSEAENDEFVITGEMYDQLTLLGYNMDQIMAFKKFGSKFPDLDVKKIKKMFDPAMSASEIVSSIEMFY